jgi:hypothetical protein
MTIPRSLDEARRDGWDEEDLRWYGADKRNKRPVEDEQPVEIVSGKLRERYRSVA